MTYRATKQENAQTTRKHDGVDWIKVELGEPIARIETRKSQDRETGLGRASDESRNSSEKDSPIKHGSE